MCSVFVFSVLAAGPSEVSAYTNDQFLKTKQLVIDFIKIYHDVGNSLLYGTKFLFCYLSILFLYTISFFHFFYFKSLSGTKREQREQNRGFGWVNSLSILSIESDLLNQIDFDAMINDFAEKKCRKVIL
jgi:hypothetical protein